MAPQTGSRTRRHITYLYADVSLQLVHAMTGSVTFRRESLHLLFLRVQPRFLCVGSLQLDRGLLSIRQAVFVPFNRNYVIGT